MNYLLRGRFFNLLAKAHYMDLQSRNLTTKTQSALGLCSLTVAHKTSLTPTQQGEGQECMRNLSRSVTWLSSTCRYGANVIEAM